MGMTLQDRIQGLREVVTFLRGVPNHPSRDRLQGAERKLEELERRAALGLPQAAT